MKGREADQWFLPGLRVSYLRSTRQWVDKGTSEQILHFSVPGRGEVTIVAEGLTGLVPVIPQPPQASVGLKELWKTLFVGGPPQRVQAFSELGRRTNSVWTLPLVERALQDTDAAPGLWESWLNRSEPWDELEQALATHRLETNQVIRHLFARARRPFFLDVLEGELGSNDPVVVRHALEELETLRPSSPPPSLKAACQHENPSVAIKAQFVLRLLESQGRT